MQQGDISKYILLWSELVDMGEACALEMIRKVQPESDAMTVLKMALEEQSEIHHRVNIEILSKLVNDK